MCYTPLPFSVHALWKTYTVNRKDADLLGKMGVVSVIDNLTLKASSNKCI